MRPDGLSDPDAEPGLPPILCQAIWRTHLGCVRKVNEDRVLAIPERGLFVVSDGMGGHRRGDLAAQAVVDGLAGADSRGSHAQRTQAASDALETVNRELCTQALAHGIDTVMGATVVALIFDRDRYSCIWAGDSRGYLWRDNRLERLTRDHSVTQDLIDQNFLEEADRRFHPQASVITRAIGVNSTLELEIVQGGLRPGDRFLLCSDGVCGMLDDQEIAAALRCTDAQQSADRLVDGVFEGGAEDNLSFVLISVAAAKSNC